MWQTEHRRSRLGTSVPSIIVLPFFIVVLSVSSLARAGSLTPDEIRVSESLGRLHNVSQYGIVYRLPGARLFRASYLEAAAGVFQSSFETRGYASIGAVWRISPGWLPLIDEQSFVDFGFSPTWIAGSDLNGRTLGGNVHFTSSLALGKYLNREQRVALSLRVQHTSNGGLRCRNPGLDMIGLTISFQR